MAIEDHDVGDVRQAAYARARGEVTDADIDRELDALEVELACVAACNGWTEWQALQSYHPHTAERLRAKFEGEQLAAKEKAKTS